MTLMGWDLGGANLKLARVEAGRVVDVAQIPCPVMQDRGKFDAALEAAMPLVPAGAVHAVTMTGELSDVFADRTEGVAYLVAMMRHALPDQALRFYGGRAGFLATEDAAAHVSDIASANWHATGALAASRVRDGLLLDIGSTTTDLVPFREGRVTARGYSDGERLTDHELIYAGVVRTPVMAIAREAPFQGRMQGVAAERFATMADVYRLTGDLAHDADPYPTPDHCGKSVEESAARLARMLGRDANEAPLAEWIAAARHFAECQLAHSELAAATLIAREALDASAPIIGAGCGRFLAERLAARLGRPYLDVAELMAVVPEAREMAARCAPAVAVALLAEGLERNC